MHEGHPIRLAPTQSSQEIEAPTELNSAPYKRLVLMHAVGSSNFRVCKTRALEGGRNRLYKGSSSYVRHGSDLILPDLWAASVCSACR